jgi:hypothetical protein
MDVLAPADLRGLGIIFVVPMLWFVARTVRSYQAGGPRSADVVAQQVIACGAMAYMLLALAGPSARPTAGNAMVGMSMSGSPTASSPVLRLVVIAAIAGLCGWTIVRLRVRSMEAGPAMGVGCQLAVNATTIYMLIVM